MRYGIGTLRDNQRKRLSLIWIEFAWNESVGTEALVVWPYGDFRANAMMCHAMTWRDTTWHEVTQGDTTWHKVTRRDTMWRDMTWSHVTWRDMTRHDVTWRDLTWHDVTWHDVAWRGMNWNDVKWRDMTWLDVKWCGMTWHDVKRCAMTWRDRTRHDVTWCDMTWHDVTWQYSWQLSIGRVTITRLFARLLINLEHFCQETNVWVTSITSWTGRWPEFSRSPKQGSSVGMSAKNSLTSKT